jgi:hypothetical protein
MPDQRIADRIAIQDALYRYVRGVDRRDWDRVRSAYHADAYDDHGGYKGDIDGFIAHLIRRHATIEQSMHVIGNMVFEFVGPDSALVETYFITYQRLAPEAGDARLGYLRGAPIGPDQALESEIIGRYVDHFTRRDGAWKVAHRTVVAELVRGIPAPRGGGVAAPWALANRDGNDPIERKRAELGLPRH